MILLRPSGALLLTCLLSTQELSRTSAHSWLECTDYRMDPKSADAKTWNPSVCHGRARCGGAQMNAKFGQDTGFNEHSAKCQCARDSPKNVAPVAQYTPGQRVCLAYPPKNHVAAPCTNAFIPDAGVRIMRSAVNPTSDDSLASEYKQGNGEHKFGQIDYKGFQNCPNFCDNKEGALCTMCFDLESDLAPGSYTFKWVWAFNNLEDVYTTCWEATVGGSSGAQASMTPGTTAPPASSPPNITTSTPTVTTATVGATHAATAADDDCDDELDMANDDCDDELDLAGGAEIGGDAEANPQANPSTMGGTSKNGNAHDASNPSRPSEHGSPTSGANPGYGTTPSALASESAKPQLESGAGPSSSTAYGATTSHASAPRNQHGSHHRWHMSGQNGGNQQHSNGQQHPNGKPGNDQPHQGGDNEGGDDDPDCALPIANTQQPTSAPVMTPTEIGHESESAKAAGGGAPSGLATPAPNKADPDCEDELPYAYATRAPLVSGDNNDDDCDDELPMPEAAIATGGGGGHEHEHAHPGDSYSFNANPQSKSDKATFDGVVGSVLPYSGKY